MTIIAQAEFEARLAQVQLLALDVDGVLTDGGLYYTETGEELKKFNVKDGLGIQRAMGCGVQVAIFSAGSSSATLHRAKRLGIKHIYLRVPDKLAAIKQLCETLAIPLDRVAYMGDDLVDIPAMQTVGVPITVADAMPENQAVAVYITQKSGGQGAVREICDLIAKQHSSTDHARSSYQSI
ncbi:HAD-IIIA family hydrolase [Cyanobacteria bacterium FACHB-DQ100]|uniref:KdsC family phosphatase n=1 Tax=unclassified Leptolyngbya TaxID=2650499 RepID=UPI00168040EF|nr:HAD-IIIA family hydrolase [Leptolyngbya sp. FACHB-17]MBD1823579.1 HAD-IIIA family hydrolase [Cyanobacteria bacterium FACHB-DQ100]MBD2080256.1 HAD-IIIA family hydrolase [Leptolyngbya sp. FACHB-17]